VAPAVEQAGATRERTRSADDDRDMAMASSGC